MIYTEDTGACYYLESNVYVAPDGTVFEFEENLQDYLGEEEE